MYLLTKYYFLISSIFVSSGGWGYKLHKNISPALIKIIWSTLRMLNQNSHKKHVYVELKK
jgi:hypothetical protein